MKLRMAENSVFAVLLRSPWWISAGIAAAIFAALRLAVPDLYAFGGTLPFVVITFLAGWRQLRAPSAVQVADMLGAIRGMSWDDFSSAIENAFRNGGYRVNRLKGAEADFELSREGRVHLLACRRWKVARTGIEPLRALDAARRAGDAHECVYVAAGEFTDQARAFAGQNRIRLIHDAELAKLLPRAGGPDRIFSR